MSDARGRLAVLGFEAFFGASHEAFIQGLAAGSRHVWELVTLPARRWKDRMLKGAEALANCAQQLGADFDLVFATDMLDLVRLGELLPDDLQRLPKVLYFHENQLTYPVRFARDDYWRLGLVNIHSALAAERVVFNSEFHRSDFLGAIPGFLERLPQEAQRPELAAERIAERSLVVHPGIDVAGIPCPDRSLRSDPLVILWNHRWEHDKRPEAFFAALGRLLTENCEFRVIICGESFTRRPQVFDRAQALFGERLLHFGFAQDTAEYRRLLGAADVAVSTAAHEFFGIAWLEACAAGCMPLVPDRLSYPGLVPQELHQQCIYAADEEFFQRLRTLCADPTAARNAASAWRAVAEQFAWPQQARIFDDLLGRIRG
jgi:glycosyltransferase involved in cell wall biosynthesis